jgi:hypothetical protein
MLADLITLNIKNYIPRESRKFILYSGLIFVVIFCVENNNHRFWLNDFRVYYLAAKALIGGEQVYGVSFGLGTGFFKYSPMTLLLITPYVIFPIQVANIIHFLISSCCIIAAFLVLEQIIVDYLFVPRTKRTHLLLVAVLFCVLNHLFREVHLGNINMVIVLLLSLALRLVLKSQPITAGLLLALVIITKPYFIFFCLLPLLTHRKIKAILSMIVFLLIFFAIPFVFLGFSKNISLHQQWFSAMFEHSSYLYSNHTIVSLIQFYIYSAIPYKFTYYLIVLVGLLYIIYFGLNNQADTKNSNASMVKNKSFIIQYFLLIAIVPNLLITDTEHFLFALPLITILVFFLPTSKNYILVGCFILLAFLYGGNSPDLLGKEVSRQFENYGLLGLSNLIIILFIIYIYSKNKTKWIAENGHISVIKN